MLRATDDTVVITIRGIGDMTSRNPDSFIDLSTSETDFDRPKAVVHLGNAKATAQDFPGSAQTQNDRTTWDAMDVVSDKIALIFAGDEPFDILASPTSTYHSRSDRAGSTGATPQGVWRRRSSWLLANLPCAA